MRVKFFTIFCLALLAYIGFSSRSGGPAVQSSAECSGAPGTGSCANCHNNQGNGFAATTLLFKNSAGALVTSVQPDSVYDVSFQVTAMGGATAVAYGFQAVFLSDSANTNAGNFTSLGTGQQTFTFGNGRMIVEHSLPSFSNNTFNFKWRAPSYLPGGTATLYARGLIANMNGNATGDVVSGVDTVRIGMTLPSSTNQLAQSNIELSLYPNPVVTDLNLIFNVAESTQFNISVFNSNGQKVSSEVFNANSGSNQHRMSVNDLSAGLYRLVLEDGQGKLTNKSFVKF